jgi:hypothetical protein
LIANLPSFDKSLHLTYSRPGVERGVRLRPNTEVVSRKLGDRLVVVNLRTNRIYELNSTASRIWELLEAGSDRTEIEETLLGEFDVEPSVASVGIDGTLARFSAEGLIGEREAA